MSTSNGNRAGVLLVDRIPAVREALAARLSKLPDLAPCGEADDEAEALRLIAEARPAAAVIDITLKAGNGIDLIKRAKVHEFCPVFILWSLHAEGLYAERALRAGASGYISKEHPTEEVIATIRKVLAGEVCLGPEIAGRGSANGSTIDRLSDRELQAFELLGHGLTTEAVAAKMRISAKTVETYRVRIKEKLGIGTINELIREAVQWVASGRA